MLTDLRSLIPQRRDVAALIDVVRAGELNDTTEREQLATLLDGIATAIRTAVAASFPRGLRAR